MVLVTQRPSHAFESVRDLPLAELQLYAGIIAVSAHYRPLKLSQASGPVGCSRQYFHAAFMLPNKPSVRACFTQLSCKEASLEYPYISPPSEALYCVIAVVFLIVCCNVMTLSLRI